MTSAITDDIITKVAKLARIKLTAHEAATFARQLSPVLDHIGHLNQLDTTNVFPTYQVTSLQNVFRSDETADSLSQDAATAPSPKKSNGYIVMPKTIDK